MPRASSKIPLVGRLVISVYFLQVGVVLIVAPWTTFWDGNYFMESQPFVQLMFKTSFMRGGVSGIGVINLWAGAVDLIALWKCRQHLKDMGGSNGNDSADALH